MRKRVFFVFVLLLTLVLAGVAYSASINDELFQAIRNKDIQKVKAVLSRGADVKSRESFTDSTPLIGAAESGHTEIARLLLEKGSDVNAKDRILGYTALMYAAFGGRTEIAKLLIEKGAQVSGKNNDGATALHIACMRCSTETARLLVEKGADVNARDNRGWTPLMDAAGSCRAEITKLLIAKGADVNAKNNQGNTALYAAEINAKTDVIAALREAGAQGGKLPAQVPSALGPDEIKFLSDQCLIDRSDIEIIPKLEKEIQQKLFARIAIRDCKLLSSFKGSRSYYRQLKPKTRLPMPPAVWNADYLTPEEFDKYKEILDSAPL